MGTGPGKTNGLVSADLPSTSVTLDPRVERERFRAFLERRVGGVDQAAWYLDHLRPRLALNAGARLATEEVVDHVGRLMGFDTTRDRDEGISTWRLPSGARLLVAVVDGTGAVAGLTRAARAGNALSTEPGDHLLGLLCVTTALDSHDALQRAIELRRIDRPVRLVASDALLALARSVARGSLTLDVAVAVLTPGASADALVNALTGGTP